MQFYPVEPEVIEGSRSYRFNNRILAMILAGGKGERLYPLTEHRAKPAVPFGGICRLIDFALSNMVNSGIHQIYILTQYKAHSLLRHLQQGWTVTHPNNGYFIMPVPAQMRARDTWYLGTADAVYQNLHLIKGLKPDMVLVFGADHVYSMDIRQMIRSHLDKEAEVTVATIPMPLACCSKFGTICVDREWRIRKFQEKVSNPTPIPIKPDQALVSMGNYIFNTQVLLDEIQEDAHNSESSHDFGKDILPKVIERRRAYAYDFGSNIIPGIKTPSNYWRDVGTIESFYHANMDLNKPLSHLNLYNAAWPVRSVKYHELPAKVERDLWGRMGCVEHSLIGGSTIVSGGYVGDSVIGQNVYISSRAVVEESVILGNVTIEEGAKIRRAIIDHGNVIEAGNEIGYDQNKDARNYHLDDSGVVVVPHNHFYRSKKSKKIVRSGIYLSS